jgi:RimJ/RimL family protein N-acetyltransferase
MQTELDISLKTERLFLRPLQIDDVELLWPDISDPEISRYMAWEPHYEKSQTLEFLRNEVARREAKRGVTWGIFKNDDFCGIASLIALVRSYRSLIYDKAELAYWLRLRHQKQGIMTEAIYQVMKFAFQDLALHKLCVSHFSPNIASEKLIRRLGFRYIGEQLEEYQKNGIWHNQKNYEILNKEFHEITIPSFEGK